MKRSLLAKRARARGKRIPLGELLTAFAVSIVALVAALFGPVWQATPNGRLALAAAERMQRASEILRAYRIEHGPAVDPVADFNETGLIGAFYSPMTTTVGHLEAKRTTTNPNFAGLMVHLLLEAGVEKGDFVAVGASGSFPALILAVLSAAEVLDLQAGLVSSLGASQFGANELELVWLDIEEMLVDAGVLSAASVAASLGGDLDIGRDMAPDTQEFLIQKIDEHGLPLVYEPDLVTNVQQRMTILKEAAGEREIAAFVNIGGAWANLGVDATILGVPPGIANIPLPVREEDGGLVHAMASAGIPVIHMLNIRELTQQYGLPWDPSPLPEPSASAIRERRGPAGWDVAFLLGMGAWLVSIWLRRRRGIAG